jgi:hypothetical protein
MRLRPPFPAERRTPTQRRPHVIGRPAPTTPAPARGAVHPDPRLLAERRHRASVAPEDNALYLCGCGSEFSAAVSTTVTCPSCGSGQDW